MKTHIRSDLEVLLAISFPQVEKSEHTHLPRPECPDLGGAGGKHKLHEGGGGLGPLLLLPPPLCIKLPLYAGRRLLPMPGAAARILNAV